MSETHLNNLRSEIEKNHWVISSELCGNDYDISGIWILERPNKNKKLHLEFEGLDETGVLPLIKSYGCKIQEHPEISVYFSRKNRSWPEELNQFINKLKTLNNE